MSRRRAPRRRVVNAGVGVVGVILVGVNVFVVGVNVFVVFVVLVVLGVWARARAPVRGRRVRGRRTRSGGVGGLRVCRGGTRRGLLGACTSVECLVDYLLDRAVDRLPAAVRARFAEEWLDHRQHYCGWQLVWWALWVRATALRTVTALEPARLPREE
jgi:hypothetical protein